MIGVDVGGTFTDVIAIRDGKPVTVKIQTRRESVHLSVLEGAKAVDPTQSNVFNHASTHGLNAVLTRRLPKVGLLATMGHRDVMDRARLIRPVQALTDPSWRRSFSDSTAPMVPRYLRRGVVERMTASGEAMVPLDEAQVIEQLQVLKRCNVEGVAIAFLHSHVNGTHERRVAELVAEHLPGVRCSYSSDVSPLAKEYARTSTTVIDVIMKIIYTDYDAELQDGLRELGFTGQLNYADSAATLVPAKTAMDKPYRIVFSGPSAGTAACVHLGVEIDDHDMLCVDIGGTSCDLSVITAGSTHRNTTFEFEYDMVVNSLSTDISTLGAGGGSIATVNELGELRVGPESAGGTPGPACYGLGGTEPTMTDAALLMGFIDPGGFAGGTLKLHAEHAATAFESLAMAGDLGHRVTSTWRIGLNNIVEGIYNVALARGLDSSDFSVVAFGAAGPMMLPFVLDQVKLRRVVVPPHPGLFSALGLLATDLVFSDSRSAYTVLAPESAESIAAHFREMEDSLLSGLGDAERASSKVVRTFDGRLLGQGWDMPLVTMPSGELTADSIAEMVTSFHDHYQRRNGIRLDAFPVEAVTFRASLVVPSERFTFERPETRTSGKPEPLDATTIRFLYGDDVSAPVYLRDTLLAGDRIVGPAIVREPMSTTVVPDGRTLTVGTVGEMYVH
ncbi:hydantoinase/oxoprolinase family protein [Mycolicibacterium hodleri]|uniref:Hydantoinase/oxoprolinase family protein n=1 Tax=Mycolicibacterium hodleri TaxID=49897 RepID=A0A502E7K3_9MYCO|nr:hydantoinase/oxoprolinase family protein [Mycolicibacterium hodleri]TPG32476.1 hydantoinase/oxoprolinase family protein [Mycolicibacterium hodleri]